MNSGADERADALGIPAEHLVVYTHDDTGWEVLAHHRDELDAKYAEWKRNGRDSTLELDTIFGGTLLIAASEIAFLCNSTPETRRRVQAWEYLLAREANEFKREFPEPKEWT